jgi:homoserine kinase
MLALAGRPDLLMAGTEDRLHQEYRRGVLPASMAVMDSLREQGYPAVISGAGPTVLVLSPLAEQTRFTLENHGWSVLTPGIDTRGAVLTS